MSWEGAPFFAMVYYILKSFLQTLPIFLKATFGRSAFFLYTEDQSEYNTG